MASPMLGFPGTAPLPRTGTTAGETIAAAELVLALPSAVLGFGTNFQTPLGEDDAPRVIDVLHAEGTGARLARALSLSFLGHGPLYPFTPAKNPNRPDRSVTVAVRLDSQALKTITVLGPKAEPAGTESPLRIAQTGFNLGVARGYQNFAPELPAAPPVPHRSDTDANRFSLTQHSAQDARFGGRAPGADRQQAPHGFAGDRDGPVDLGSSYRVTRNIAVTAGVRYSQDRERLKPLTDGNQDNQAVYVGTQFKF